ncbi:concanavalin A-like lectin protein kinase family protein [Striga asiatica]|uniref:Concanavalin A-like lectin protein kinase family protein n=1 Tax=Striga asiatica TaxID=4170 RepID=A0A5A7PPT8_STRAF|nr:concanavalin A-like lectin protein kinase family protein [Striga asiatica]
MHLNYPPPKTLTATQFTFPGQNLLPDSSASVEASGATLLTNNTVEFCSRKPLSGALWPDKLRHEWKPKSTPPRRRAQRDLESGFSDLDNNHVGVDLNSTKLAAAAANAGYWEGAT